MTTVDIRITVDGKPAHTTDQLAALHGIRPDSMRKRLQRQEVKPIAYLDARTPLYDAAAVEKH